MFGNYLALLYISIFPFFFQIEFQEPVKWNVHFEINFNVCPLPANFLDNGILYGFQGLSRFFTRLFKCQLSTKSTKQDTNFDLKQ